MNTDLDFCSDPRTCFHRSSFRPRRKNRKTRPIALRLAAYGMPLPTRAQRKRCNHPCFALLRKGASASVGAPYFSLNRSRPSVGCLGHLCEFNFHYFPHIRIDVEGRCLVLLRATIA